MQSCQIMKGFGIVLIIFQLLVVESCDHYKAFKQVVRIYAKSVSHGEQKQVLADCLLSFAGEDPKKCHTEKFDSKEIPSCNKAVLNGNFEKIINSKSQEDKIKDFEQILTDVRDSFQEHYHNFKVCENVGHFLQKDLKTFLDSTEHHTQKTEDSKAWEQVRDVLKLQKSKFLESHLEKLKSTYNNEEPKTDDLMAKSFGTYYILGYRNANGTVDPLITDTLIPCIVDVFEKAGSQLKNAKHNS